MLERKRVESLGSGNWKNDLLTSQKGKTVEGQVGVGDVRVKSFVLDMLGLSCLSDIQVDIQDKQLDM